MYITMKMINMLKYIEIHDHQRSLFNKYIITIITGTGQDRARTNSISFNSKSEQTNYINTIMNKYIKNGYIRIYEYPKNLCKELKDYQHEKAYCILL